MRSGGHRQANAETRKNKLTSSWCIRSPEQRRENRQSSLVVEEFEALPDLAVATTQLSETRRLVLNEVVRPVATDALPLDPREAPEIVVVQELVNGAIRRGAFPTELGEELFDRRNRAAVVGGFEEESSANSTSLRVPLRQRGRSSSLSSSSESPSTVRREYRPPGG